VTHLAVSQLSGLKLTVPDNLLKIRLFVGVTTHYSSASKLGSFPPLSLSSVSTPLALLAFSVTTRNVLRVLCDVCCQWTSHSVSSPTWPKTKSAKGVEYKKKMAGLVRGKTYLHTSSSEKGSSWVRVEYRGSQTPNSRSQLYKQNQTPH